MNAADIASILTAIGVILTALVSLRNGRRINHVKDAVNGGNAQSSARVDQLTAALTSANVDVPPDRRLVTPVTSNESDFLNEPPIG